jgi:hypothetical protein
MLKEMRRQNREQRRYRAKQKPKTNTHRKPVHPIKYMNVKIKVQM